STVWNGSKETYLWLVSIAKRSMFNILDPDQTRSTFLGEATHAPAREVCEWTACEGKKKKKKCCKKYKKSKHCKSCPRL
ncbi:MAG: hypothetical protein AAGN35_13175, partial [Bacteroidota bacterium]